MTGTGEKSDVGGTGALVAGSAYTEGQASLSLTVSGNLVGQPAGITATGVVLRVIVAGGNLNAQRAQLSGVGVRIIAAPGLHGETTAYPALGGDVEGYPALDGTTGAYQRH